MARIDVFGLPFTIKMILVSVFSLDPPLTSKYQKFYNVQYHYEIICEVGFAKSYVLATILTHFMF